MTKMLDIEQIELDARRVVDAKVATVRRLAQARQARFNAAAALDAAESSDVEAYDAALGHGWSESELRHLGLEEPTTVETLASADESPAPRHDALGYLSAVTL
jgi:hypothetical protein